MPLLTPLSPRSWRRPQTTFVWGDGLIDQSPTTLWYQVLVDYIGRGNLQDPIARLLEFQSNLGGGSERLLRQARKIIRPGNPGIVRGGLRPTARASRPYVWNDLLSRRIAEQLIDSSLGAGHA
jgi:hypothetical protein